MKGVMEACPATRVTHLQKHIGDRIGQAVVQSRLQYPPRVTKTKAKYGDLVSCGPPKLHEYLRHAVSPISENIP